VRVREVMERSGSLAVQVLWAPITDSPDSHPVHLKADGAASYRSRAS